MTFPCDYCIFILSITLGIGIETMKTSAFKLPVEASREVALAIIDQLPDSEFSKVVRDIRSRSRDRALGSLRRLRTAVRKSGLRKKDFDEALRETRADKNKRSPRRRP